LGFKFKRPIILITAGVIIEIRKKKKENAMVKRVKDSTFTYLFKHAKYAVDLYKMVSGKSLDPETIRIVLLQDDVEKPRLYNDVAFLTEDNRLLALFEHQSTQNPNMIYRMLEYYVKFIGKYVKEIGADKYGPKEIQFPKAEFYVLYNGKGMMPELPTLDLGAVKVEAALYNIHFDGLENKDPNNAVVAYAKFVDLIEKGFDKNAALDKMVSEGYLLEFFGRKELRDMFADVFSYDQELIDQGVKKGVVIGIEQGIERGKIESVVAVMDLLTDEQLANRFDMSIEKIRQIRQSHEVPVN
jgi:hypothetical protein